MADEEVKTDAVSEETANDASTETQAVVTDASPEVTTDSTPAPEAAAPAVEEKPVETTSAETAPAPAKPKGEKHGLGHLILVAVLALLVVGLGLWAWTLHSDNQDLKKQITTLNNNPLLVAEKKDKQATQELVTKVGALISLPKDEVPQAVLVTDANEARKGNPVFYANAENGDKILVFTKGGKAILYRPSTNKIILVAPLTTSTKQ